MGKLFYIMGKSASGKDTIYQKLLENPELHFRRLIIYTTRPIRDGEKDGQEYYFVNEDEFQCLKASGKIIEDRGYESVYGLWRYFTVDNMNLEKYNYLGIGTLESYEQLKKYYGENKVCPVYIEVEDGMRLKRAIAREETQEIPKYEEMCRRFLADSQDFSEANIKAAGISRRFQNMDFITCMSDIEKYVKSVLY
ncbi:guanylate kinase [Frisingicoccus sp.]|uniref:guanylate kinase n=1 Tax=Frisingicoccus sp. TaxID=1918627 RepID=UPI0025C2F2EA|nr:guanylate kinase [Frisingicoccus sp.]